MPKKKITPEQELTICNLVSTGVPLAEAKKRVLSKPEAPSGGGEDGKPKKLSAGEKKAAMVPEFEALEVEPPAESESVAKWEQALATAKEEAANAEGGDAEGGDAEGGDAEGGDAEGGDAAEDLM